MAHTFDLARRSFIAVDDLTTAYAWSDEGDDSALGGIEGLGAVVARLAAVLGGDVRARGQEPVCEALLAP